MNEVQKLIGQKAIAHFLGCSESMIDFYARLGEDPLPVRVRLGRGKGRGTLWIRSDYATDWKERRKADPRTSDLPRVEGWDAITAMLGHTDRRRTRYLATAKRDRLPVHGMRANRPWIYATALRDWVQRNDIPWQVCGRPSCPNAPRLSIKP